MPSEHKNLTARQQQAEARREHILESAVMLFARHGFDGTSTKQIAKAAGISEGLIFHYFPTKSDLLSAILESQHGFTNDLRKLLRGSEDRPAAEVLPQLAALWFEKLRQEKAITLILFGTAQTDPKVGEAFKQIIDNGVALLADYLRKRVDVGELRPDLSTETGALMFFSSIIIHFVRYRDLAYDDWQQAVSAIADEMVAIWLQGFEA